MSSKFTSKEYTGIGCLLISLVLAMSVLLVGAHPAHADTTFCLPAGSGAGECDAPSAVAVNLAKGEVFVADERAFVERENNRIDVFSAGGGFLRAFGWDVIPSGRPGDAGTGLEVCTTATQCKAASKGSAAGQFNRPTAIAVDNSCFLHSPPLDETTTPKCSEFDPADGDVYVFDSKNARVERFQSDGSFVLAFGAPGTGPGQFSSDAHVAVGGDGRVYVADQNHVQRFDRNGVLLDNFTAITFPDVSNLGITVDSAGDFYINVQSVVRKYNSAGTPLYSIDPFPTSTNTRAIAVDADDNLFLADNTKAPMAIYEYDSAGNPLHVFYGNGTLSGAQVSLAPYSDSGGDVFTVDSSTPRFVAHIAKEPVGPVVLPDLTEASGVGNTQATLTAYVNPEGNANTTAHLEYIVDADYSANGNSFSGAHPATATAEAVIGSDFSAHQFSADIGCTEPQVPPQPSCLAPETTYRFRAVATDGAHTATGPTESFTTKPPLAFGATYSAAVGTSTATLHAELNPLSIAATGRIQYVDEATYLADNASGDGFQHAIEAPAPPNPPLDFGNAADEMVSRSVAVEGLAPGTAYRFRLVASDPFVTRNGPEASFRTFAAPAPPGAECSNQVFRSGNPSVALPDCRAYEMVSPPEKGGADLGGLNNVAILPFLNRGSLAQIRQATPLGSRITYSSPRPFVEPEAAPWTSQYLATRTSSGWQSDNITPPSSTNTLYGHGAAPPTDDLRFQAFGSDLCAGFLIQDTDTALTAADNAGYGDLYRRDNCAETAANPYTLLTTAAPSNQSAGYPSTYYPRTQGFSADGQTAVFRANGKLPTAGVQASSVTGESGHPIYQLYLTGAGSSPRLVSVMPDGTAASTNSSLGTFRDSNVSFRPDTLAGALSADGSRAYWTSPVATFSPPKLYLRINAELAQSPISGGQCANLARACTLAVSESVDPGSAVFWGATADAGKALFSFTSGAHTGELYSYDLAKALAGEPPASQIASGLTGVMGASADLSRVYVVSSAALDAGVTAGRDNLYLYEAGQGLHYIADLTTSVASSGDGANRNLYGTNPFRHFARVSADGSHAAFFAFASPTGVDNADAQSGAPDGQVYLYDAGADRLSCVSCNPSGGRPEGQIFRDGTSGQDVSIASYISGAEDSLYFPRNLSADGSRLFFTSYDALLPGDINGAADVYQWQAPDTGECETSDANYFEADDGCLSLISTGKSPDDSEFVDASADGSDVFLTTRSQLYGADTDTLLDIYDARVNGGFPAPSTPPPCDLDAGACEGAGSSASALPGAGSAAFQGPPDPKPAFEARCPKGRRKTHSHGKVRCVKPRHSKKDHGHRKRRTANHRRRTQR